MATFVHLTAERNLKSILRNGIRTTQLILYGKKARGVYCSPVTPNFYATHQWLRELKRWKSGPIVAVYLRIPDDEHVVVGRYNEKHFQVTAAEAFAMAMQSDYIGGFEVIVPRKIVKDEILRVKSVSQVIGWRNYPESKGKLPYLPYGGLPGAQKARDFWDRYWKDDKEKENDDLENDRLFSKDEEL